MQTQYQELFHFSITIWEVIANVLVATVCGSFISLFYSLTHRQITYSVSFAKSMVMLSMITSFVMMVIGDNLARAFGMVGLISLIQFRTTMKGARDFMFIYFALAIGLAAGVGLYAVSLIGTFSIGFIIWAVTAFKPATRLNQVFTLQVTSGLTGDREQDIEKIVQKFCLKYKLQGSKSGVSDQGVFTRLSYHIMLKNGESGHCLMQELHSLGVKEISVQSLKN
jgi:uncharacterized membrane protein YhiD involved in acid resistance